MYGFSAAEGFTDGIPPSPSLCRPLSSRPLLYASKISSSDGWMDVLRSAVNQGVEDMIKYLANEPSAGLFYVQQHTRSAMPNVLQLKDKILEKTHNTVLQTEDLEDSISCVKSMSECGFQIVDEMVKDINKSLLLMSTAQPRKGLLRSSSRGFQMKKENSQVSSSFTEFSSRGELEGGNGRGGYLSSVFSSVKHKAAKLGWSQVDSMAAESRSGSSSTPRSLERGDELPLSSQITDELAVVESTSDNFEKFKSEQEAKLKEWLEEV